MTSAHAYLYVSVTVGILVPERKEISMKVALSLLEKMLNFWKQDGDGLYEWFGAMAAMSALASVASKTHPTEVGATVSSFVGLEAVSRWLTVDAPPILMFRSIFWQNVFMAVVVVVVVAMVVLPVLREERNEERGVRGLGVEYEMKGLLWSRVARTLWVVFAICCQVGPPERLVGALCALAVLAVVLLVTALVWRVVLERFPDIVLAPMSVCLSVVWTSVAFLFLAVLNAAFSPLIRIVSWLFSSESDSHREVREQIIENRSEVELPSGAVSLVEEVASRPTEGYSQTRVPRF